MSRGKSQGIKSRNVVRKPVRQGSQRERVTVSGIAQLGQRQGDHAMRGDASGYRGINAFTGKPGMPSELGNAKAEATVCGPGGSRTIYKTGTMGTHGSVNPGQPMTPKGEIFPGFGPDRKG